MNISLSKILLLAVGAILLIAGVYFGIDAMKSKDALAGLFAVIAIAIGCVLVSGRVLTVSA